MMKRVLVALAGAACALAAGAAQARDVYWSVGVSSPGVGAVFSNAPPVYVAPAPVYYAPPPPVYYVEPAPVYYAPPRVVYRPAPVYYVGGHGHHHKHKWRHRHGGHRDEYGDHRGGRWRDDPRNYRH